MKRYYIKQVQGSNVCLYAESVDEMTKRAMKFSEDKYGGSDKIYVLADVATATRKKHNYEKDVRYMIYINNQKMTIITKRI